MFWTAEPPPQGMPFQKKVAAPDRPMLRSRSAGDAARKSVAINA
jgi:hypothetical protein